MALPQIGQRPQAPVLTAGALTLLVVLAGCNVPGLSGPDYPPGVNESGVQNATALANAHESGLQTGYRAESHSTVVAENGTTLVPIESHRRWSPSAANRTVRYSREHPVFGTHSEIYSNDSAIFVRYRQGGGNFTTLRLEEDHIRILNPGPDSEWETIYGIIGAQQTSTVLFDNGTTRIRVRHARLGRGTGNATLYVTQDGLVTRYSVTYQSRYLTTPVTLHTRTAYTHVGNPNVEKPDWVANVSTATAARSRAPAPETWFLLLVGNV